VSPPRAGLAQPVVQGGSQQEDDEPNDTFDDAEIFDVPGIMNGVLSVAITDTKDCYDMSFVNTGDSYKVTLYDDTVSGLDLNLFDGNRNPVATETTGSNGSVSITWEVTQNRYYVCVELSQGTLTSDADYRLFVPEPESPTATPTQTSTPIPTPSDGLVETEPNDGIAEAIFLPLNQIMYGAIAGIYDQDYYYTELDPGQRYRIILNDWEYARRVEVYDAAGNFMEQATTASGNVELTFVATDETHYIGIFKSQTSSPEGTTVDYDLRIYQIQSTPTPTTAPTNTPAPGTPTPAPTWASGYDQYEPNFSFETAQTIAPDVTYELNFTPWGGATEPDNDYFKLWVKPRLFFTCETFDLGAVVDTNMILYDANRTLIGGNDDRVLGDYSSKVSYYSSYEGYLYVLVGTGDRLSFEDAKTSPYKLKCTKSVPGTPTATVDDDDDDGASKAPTPRPTATPPSSPVATPTLSNTPTPEEGGEATGTVALSIRPLTTPPPMAATPTPSGFRTFRLVVYYDVNADGQFGAGEGVPGFFVRVLPASGGEELAHGYTDDQGQISFSVPTVRTVRIIVPFLGLDRSVDPAQPEVKVRIAPLPLPDAIP
jgi:hypothetical protein